MSSMFRCSEFNGDISKWNVSKVKKMISMFYGSIFNENIYEWKNKECLNARLGLKGYDKETHFNYLKTKYPEYLF